MNPPNKNLQPGQSGPDVKELQDWLVQMGYMTAAQVASGPGIYGPQTTSAVKKLQQALGVDNSSGPGYWGPKTLAAVSPLLGGQNQSNTPAATQPSSPQPQPLDANSQAGLSYLFTPQQVSAMSPTDQKQWAMVGEYLKGQSDLGQTVAVNNAASMQQAYVAALHDPNITAKYGDLQKEDVQSFQKNLQSMQTGADITSATNSIDFQNQQKALNENAAAAGQAYSGFRNLAQQQLNTKQSGIVQSTIQQYKDSLRSMAQPLESFYGSTQFNSIFGNPSVNFGGQSIGYTPVGNVVGSETAQKQSDVSNRQQQIYQGLQTPQ